MKLKKLKKNVTHAHLLYYLTLIFCIPLVILAVASTIDFAKYLSNGQIYIDKLPVKFDLAEDYESDALSYKNLVVNDIGAMSGKISLSGSDPDIRGVIAGFHLIKIFRLALYFIILFFLSRIFKSIMDEDPFNEKNSKRFYVIGLILLLSYFVFMAYNYFIAQPFFEQFSSTQGLSIVQVHSYGDTYAFAGIFMMVLWYVFKEGTRLYNEQKLTV